MKPFSIKLFSLICLIFALSSCTEEDPRKWKYEYSEFDQSSYSRLSFPVNIRIGAIENLINDKLKGNLLKTAHIDNDQLTSDSLSLRKTGRIKVNIYKDELSIDMPVSFFLKGKFKYKLFKKEMLQNASFDLASRIKLRSKISINSEYKIVTKSRLVSIEWVEEPSVHLGSFNISVAKILDKKMEELSGQLLQKLDKEIAPTINIKKSIVNVWEKVQKEHQIKTEFGNLYFQLLPDSIGLAKINGKGKWLEIYLSCWTDLSFSLNPSDRALVSLPPLKKLKSVQRDFDIHLMLHLSYDELNRKAAKLLIGREFDIEGESIKLKAIELFGAGEKIGLFAEIEGDYKGKFYFQGLLNYNQKSKAVSFNKLDLLLEDEDLSLSMGSFMFHDTLMTLLEENLQYNLDTVFGKLAPVLETAIGKKQNYEVVELQIDSLQLNPQGVHVGPKGLFLPVSSNGSAQIFVKKLLKEND